MKSRELRSTSPDTAGESRSADRCHFARAEEAVVVRRLIGHPRRQNRWTETSCQWCSHASVCLPSEHRYENVLATDRRLPARRPDPACNHRWSASVPQQWLN